MAEVIRRLHPTPMPMSAYLASPHRGCCTFQHFNGDALYPGTTWSEEGPTEFPPPVKMPVVDGYLPTTVAYCRWFWRVIEQEKRRYDFTVIERALETATARGQTLCSAPTSGACGWRSSTTASGTTSSLSPGLARRQAETAGGDGSSEWSKG